MPPSKKSKSRGKAGGKGEEKTSKDENATVHDKIWSDLKKSMFNDEKETIGRIEGDKSPNFGSRDINWNASTLETDSIDESMSGLESEQGSSSPDDEKNNMARNNNRNKLNIDPSNPSEMSCKSKGDNPSANMTKEEKAEIILRNVRNVIMDTTDDNDDDSDHYSRRSATLRIPKQKYQTLDMKQRSKSLDRGKKMKKSVSFNDEIENLHKPAQIKSPRQPIKSCLKQPERSRTLKIESKGTKGVRPTRSISLDGRSRSGPPKRPVKSDVEEENDDESETKSNKSESGKTSGSFHVRDIKTEVGARPSFIKTSKSPAVENEENTKEVKTMSCTEMPPSPTLPRKNESIPETVNIVPSSPTIVETKSSPVIIRKKFHSVEEIDGKSEDSPKERPSRSRAARGANVRSLSLPRHGARESNFTRSHSLTREVSSPSLIAETASPLSPKPPRPVRSISCTTQDKDVKTIKPLDKKPPSGNFRRASDGTVVDLSSSSPHSLTVSRESKPVHLYSPRLHRSSQSAGNLSNLPANQGTTKSNSLPGNLNIDDDKDDGYESPSSENSTNSSESNKQSGSNKRVHSKVLHIKKRVPNQVEKKAPIVQPDDDDIDKNDSLEDKDYVKVIPFVDIASQVVKEESPAPRCHSEDSSDSQKVGNSSEHESHCKEKTSTKTAHGYLDRNKRFGSFRKLFSRIRSKSFSQGEAKTKLDTDTLQKRLVELTNVKDNQTVLSEKSSVNECATTDKIDDFKPKSEIPVRHIKSCPTSPCVVRSPKVLGIVTTINLPDDKNISENDKNERDQKGRGLHNKAFENGHGNNSVSVSPFDDYINPAVTCVLASTAATSQLSDNTLRTAVPQQVIASNPNNHSHGHRLEKEHHFLHQQHSVSQKALPEENRQDNQYILNQPIKSNKTSGILETRNSLDYMQQHLGEEVPMHSDKNDDNSKANMISTHSQEPKSSADSKGQSCSASANITTKEAGSVGDLQLDQFNGNLIPITGTHDRQDVTIMTTSDVAGKHNHSNCHNNTTATGWLETDIDSGYTHIVQPAHDNSADNNKPVSTDVASIQNSIPTSDTGDKVNSQSPAANNMQQQQHYASTTRHQSSGEQIIPGQALAGTGEAYWRAAHSSQSPSTNDILQQQTQLCTSVGVGTNAHSDLTSMKNTQTVARGSQREMLAHDKVSLPHQPATNYYSENTGVISSAATVSSNESTPGGVVNDSRATTAPVSSIANNTALQCDANGENYHNRYLSAQLLNSTIANSSVTNNVAYINTSSNTTRGRDANSAMGPASQNYPAVYSYPQGQGEESSVGEKLAAGDNHHQQLWQGSSHPSSIPHAPQNIQPPLSLKNTPSNSINYADQEHVHLPPGKGVPNRNEMDNNVTEQAAYHPSRSMAPHLKTPGQNMDYHGHGYQIVGNSNTQQGNINRAVVNETWSLTPSLPSSVQHSSGHSTDPTTLEYVPSGREEFTPGLGLHDKVTAYSPPQMSPDQGTEGSDSGYQGSGAEGSNADNTQRLKPSLPLLKMPSPTSLNFPGSYVAYGTPHPRANLDDSSSSDSPGQGQFRHEGHFAVGVQSPLSKSESELSSEDVPREGSPDEIHVEQGKRVRFRVNSFDEDIVDSVSPQEKKESAYSKLFGHKFKKDKNKQVKTPVSILAQKVDVHGKPYGKQPARIDKIDATLKNKENAVKDEPSAEGHRIHITPPTPEPRENHIDNIPLSMAQDKNMYNQNAESSSAVELTRGSSEKIHVVHSNINQQHQYDRIVNDQGQDFTSNSGNAVDNRPLGGSDNSQHANYVDMQQINQNEIHRSSQELQQHNVNEHQVENDSQQQNQGQQRNLEPLLQQWVMQQQQQQKEQQQQYQEPQQSRNEGLSEMHHDRNNDNEDMYINSAKTKNVMEKLANMQVSGLASKYKASPMPGRHLVHPLSFPRPASPHTPQGSSPRLPSPVQSMQDMSGNQPYGASLRPSPQHNNLSPRFAQPGSSPRPPSPYSQGSSQDVFIPNSLEGSFQRPSSPHQGFSQIQGISPRPHAPLYDVPRTYRGGSSTNSSVEQLNTSSEGQMRQFLNSGHTAIYSRLLKHQDSDNSGKETNYTENPTLPVQQQDRMSAAFHNTQAPHTDRMSPAQNVQLRHRSSPGLRPETWAGEENVHRASPVVVQRKDASNDQVCYRDNNSPLTHQRRPDTWTGPEDYNTSQHPSDPTNRYFSGTQARVEDNNVQMRGRVSPYNDQRRETWSGIYAVKDSPSQNNSHHSTQGVRPKSSYDIGSTQYPQNAELHGNYRTSTDYVDFKALQNDQYGYSQYGNASEDSERKYYGRDTNYDRKEMESKSVPSQSKPKFASSADIFKMMDIGRRKPVNAKPGHHSDYR